MHTTTLLRACVAILPVFTLAKDAQSTGVDADPEGPAITSAIGDARFAAVLEIIAQSTDPQASAFDAWASTRTDVHLGLNQPVSEAPVVTAAPESLRGFASKVMEAAEEGYSKVLATELHVTDAAGWSSLATEEATLVLIGKGPDTLVTSVTAASISSTSVSTGAGSAPTAAKVDRLTVLLGGAMAGAVGVAVAL